MSVKSQAQVWIEAFLKARGLQNPSGVPLYRYDVTEHEFNALPEVLRDSANQRHSPTYGRYWAAVFCMYVAEQYRRDYQKDWKWQSFESNLGLELSALDHSEVVTSGLSFWNLPIRDMYSMTIRKKAGLDTMP